MGLRFRLISMLCHRFLGTAQRVSMRVTSRCPGGRDGRLPPEAVHVAFYESGWPCQVTIVWFGVWARLAFSPYYLLAEHGAFAAEGRVALDITVRSNEPATPDLAERPAPRLSPAPGRRSAA